MGILTFSIGCFYYTDRMIEYSRGYDNLLSTINEVSSDYFIKPVEAVIDGDNFIPGINGRRVNVDKSYSNMKNRGVFDKNLLLYDVIYPSQSLNSNMDKYIVGGNSVRKNVSLVFLASSSDDVYPIVSLLNSKNVHASFFLDYDFLVKNESILSYLISQGYVIGIMGDNYADNDSLTSDTIVKKYTNRKYGYCLATVESLKNLKACSMNYNFMIKPLISFSSNISSFKKSVDNGSIISINLKNINLSLVSYLISYLEGKGFNFVNLDEMLVESFE